MTGVDVEIFLGAAGHERPEGRANHRARYPPSTSNSASVSICFAGAAVIGRSTSPVFLARCQTHIGPRWPIYDNGLAVADSFHREEYVWRHDSDETRTGHTICEP